MWVDNITKEGEQGEGNMYFGKDHILQATDGLWYHLLDKNKFTVSKTRPPSESNDPSLPKVNHMQNQEAHPAPPSTPAPAPNQPASPSKPEGDPFGKDKKDFLAFLNVAKPDYITYTVSASWANLAALKPLSTLKDFPPILAGTFNVANDRYGNLYFTPINLTIRTPGSSGSIMFNYMSKLCGPSQMKSFLTGVSYNFTAGEIVGGSITANQDFSMFSMGFGVTTKGMSLSISNQPAKFTLTGGLSW